MKKTCFGIVAVLLLAGCTFLGGMEAREKMYGKEPPVITQSFASKQVSSGEPWRVYINASDPNGDMSRFVYFIDQPSVPPDTYHVTRTKIGEDQQKNLSGYLELETDVEHPISLTLTLQVEDKAGHFSAPITFPLYIGSPNPRKIVQEAPPQGVFQEKNLGAINISLSTSFD